MKLEKFQIEQILEIEKEKIEIKKKHNELLVIRNNLLEKICLNTNFNILFMLNFFTPVI